MARDILAYQRPAGKTKFRSRSSGLAPVTARMRGFSSRMLLPAASARRLGDLPDLADHGAPAGYRIQIYDRFFPARTRCRWRLREPDRAPAQGRRDGGNSLFIDETLTRVSRTSGPTWRRFVGCLRMRSTIWSAGASRLENSSRAHAAESMTTRSRGLLLPPAVARLPLLTGSFRVHHRHPRTRYIFLERGFRPACTRLLRFAAFQNPEFYAAQAMRRRHSRHLELSPAPN